MSLTDLAIRKAKPAEKPVKMADGGGLYLLVRPDGGKWWRWDYRRPVTGKRNTLSLGTYPDTGLAVARERHAEARKLLAAGTDPGEQRKADKSVGEEKAANTFGAIADEFHQRRLPKLIPRTVTRERRLLETDLAPLRKLPIDGITAPILLAVLRKIEGRGAIETAHRCRALAGQVFRYAIATGRMVNNPANALQGALAPRQTKHFPSITEPAQVGPLLRALWGYDGTPAPRAALKLSPLLFVRPGELRAARWVDIDFDNAEWRYTATKTNTPHIVPLAAQALEILRELHPITGRSEFVFPSERDRKRFISENTINAALRRLGYDQTTMTAHGFRAMARTILDEVLGFRPDYIEHQLAHAVKDPNGRAYNRTSHLAERKKMMQAWANYLDDLRTNANVVSLRKAG